MTITKTTLSVALSGYSITNALRTSIVTPASMTGIVAPGPNKSNRIILWCEREAMEVLSVTTTTAKVVRGVLGTELASHAVGALVYVGHEQDFSAFNQDENRGGLGTYSSRTVKLETANAAALTDTVILTPEQLLQALIVGIPTAAANYTLPKAADLIAALQDFGQPFIGQSFEFTIFNESAGNYTITVVTSTGVTTVGNLLIVQSYVKRFRVIITDPVAMTYTIYALGTALNV